MNRRAETEIGQILTSVPALILVFIIMLVFVVVSGFMVKNMLDSEEDYSIHVNNELIDKNYPSKNAEPGTLIDDFLNSEVLIDGTIISVEELLMTTHCGGGYQSRDINPLLFKNFKSLSITDYYLFMEVGSSLKPNKGAWPEHYHTNLKGDLDIPFKKEPTISQTQFEKVFGTNNLQRKTVCASFVKGETLFVSPGGLGES